MRSDIVISLDAMGGDKAPHIVVEGADIARRKYPQAKFLLWGDEAQIKPLLEKYSALSKVSEIKHTDDRVLAEDKPSVALRQRRQSSMRLAIDAVAKGEADCVVSAGNTGALMAMAKFSLKVLPGVTRPAIASYFPTLGKGQMGTVMLDLGANIECDPQNLAEFAVLGGVFAREILKSENPKIGLLNVGSEEGKGHAGVKEAGNLLETLHLPGQYVGFVEGNDITNGSVDVVVTDGFTGNIALKASEGTAKLIGTMIKRSFKSSFLSWIALPFLLPMIARLKARIDPRRYNGGIFMGLKGLCIKSHGGADAIAFSNAIAVAADMAISRFNEKVEDELKNIEQTRESADTATSKTVAE